MKAGPSEAPLTSAIRLATQATWQLEQGKLADAVRSADSAHRVLPWVSQVPPVWWEVLTGPIEVYLAGWQAARDGHGGDESRLARVARRRIRALRQWSRIYPVARPMSDYFNGRLELLAGRDDSASRLFRRARDAARSRGIAHYERLSAEALARCRPLQTKPI
ncbi:MAG: hypothetical protein QM756_16055 [Polyangiaceae bacterium]